MKLHELPVPSLFKFTHKDGEFIKDGDDTFHSSNPKDKFSYRITENNSDWEVKKLNNFYSLQHATLGEIPNGIEFAIDNYDKLYFKVNSGTNMIGIVSSDTYNLHMADKDEEYTAVYPTQKLFSIYESSSKIRLVEFITRQYLKKNV